MNIRASIILDKAAVRALTHLSLFGKRKPKSCVAALLVSWLLLLLFSVSEMIAFGFNYLVLTIIIASTFSAIIMSYLYFILPTLQWKNLGKLQNTINTYDFFDTYFIVSTEGESISATSNLEYCALVRASETERYFFLWQTKASAFIIDKFVLAERADELRDALLKAPIPYIKCNW